MSRRKEPVIPSDLLDQLLAGGDAAAALQQVRLPVADAHGVDRLRGAGDPNLADHRPVLLRQPG